MARTRRRSSRRRRTRAGGRRRRFSIRSLLGRIGLGRKRRVRRHRRRRAVSSAPRRRRHRRRAAAVATNPRRRHYRRRRAMYFDYNPRRRHYRRRYRHNPRRSRKSAGALAIAPGLSLSRPMSLIMPAVIGTVAYVATSKIPAMVGVVTPLPRFGVKAAVGFGGGMLISRFLGKANGAVWVIGASINLLTDILNTYLFTTSPLTGFSAFPYQGRGYAPISGMDAYPQEFGAFPLQSGESGYPI